MTPKTTPTKLARELVPGDVMRFMGRPCQVLGVTAPWTRGNHTYVTVTLLDEGETEHLEFFANKERTILTR